MDGAAISFLEQAQGALRMTARTLFAGFVFNFSKIFSDCCLDASPLILATEDGRRWKKGYGAF